MLVFHHIGILVGNIEGAIGNYEKIFGKFNISEVYAIESQNVKVCFIGITSSAYIELIQPLSENSVVSKLLKKNISYYHIGYEVDDIEREVEKLIELNYKPFEYFNSEAFDGRKCIFLFSPDAHLIELIQSSRVNSLF
jgi:methylmalonyl-CoA/ethylmalonyl-CoA epimerase